MSDYKARRDAGVDATLAAIDAVTKCMGCGGDIPSDSLSDLFCATKDVYGELVTCQYKALHTQGHRPDDVYNSLDYRTRGGFADGMTQTYRATVELGDSPSARLPSQAARTIRNEGSACYGWGVVDEVREWNMHTPAELAAIAEGVLRPGRSVTVNLNVDTSGFREAMEQLVNGARGVTEAFNALPEATRRVLERVPAAHARCGDAETWALAQEVASRTLVDDIDVAVEIALFARASGLMEVPLPDLMIMWQSQNGFRNRNTGPRRQSRAPRNIDPRGNR